MADQVKFSQKVVEWVKANAKPSEGDNRTNEEKTLWWWCYRSAEEMAESYRIKDWASMLQEGIKPATLDDIDVQFDERIEEGETEGELWAEILAELVDMGW